MASHGLRRLAAIRRTSGTSLGVSTSAAATGSGRGALDEFRTPRKSHVPQRVPRLMYADAASPLTLDGVCPGHLLTLGAEESRHAAKVLRLRTGDEVELIDGMGHLMRGLVADVGARRTMRIEAIDAAEFHPRPAKQPSVHALVACTTLQGARADMMIEKLSELGVTSFTPVLCERSSRAARRERWQRVTVSAQKQCLRLHALELREAVTVDGFVESLSTPARESSSGGSHRRTQILLAKQGAHPISDWIASRMKVEEDNVDYVVVVGAQGDFTEKEKQKMLAMAESAQGVETIDVSLGTYRLRTETAAIAICSCVMLMLNGGG